MSGPEGDGNIIGSSQVTQDYIARRTGHCICLFNTGIKDSYATRNEVASFEATLKAKISY